MEQSVNDLLDYDPEAKPSANASGGQSINDLQDYAPKGEEVKEPEKKQKWWQGFENDSDWSGLAARLGIGAVRGAKDVLDTAAHGVGNVAATAAEKFLPVELSKPIRESVEASKKKDKEARDEFTKEYSSSDSMIPNAVDVGRLGGQIGASLPVMPARLMQGVTAAAGALPTLSTTGARVAAPIANRLLGAAGTGAVGGATLGATTASTNDESLAQNVGTGALSGLVAGPVLTGAASAAKTAGGKIIGGISHTTADLAKRAEELGIDLKGSQVSSSPLVKKFDQMSGMLPFSGAQGTTDKQVGQFTRAISRTFGEDSSEITPEMIANARKRIGGNMENIYKGSTSTVDKNLHDDLRTVLDNAHATMTPDEIGIVVKQIRNVASKVDQNGQISGEAYHGLTKYDAVLSKAQQSSNPNIANAATHIRQSLEGLLDRNLPPDEKAALMKARAQYKAAMTVKDLVDQSAEGHVSPLKLMQKVNKSPGGKLRSGELGELADIGRKFFPTPADSGTPWGEKVLNAVTSFTHNPAGVLGAGAAALYHGALLTDATMGGLGLAANRLTRSAINSKATVNALIRSGTGETHGLTKKLVGKVTPYAGLPVIYKDEKREPLRITVTR